MKPTKEQIEEASENHVSGYCTLGDDKYSYVVGFFIGANWAISKMEQKWIPVSERLPVENEKVLVLFKYQISADEFTDISIGYLAYDSDDDMDWWLNDQDYPTEGITHWLPLPEKP